MVTILGFRDWVVTNLLFWRFRVLRFVRRQRDSESGSTEESSI
jgi:hypothetical protein